MFILRSFLLFLLCFYSFSLLSNLENGNNFSYYDLKKIELGISKARALEVFGNPTIYFDDFDCICYLYFKSFNSNYYKNIKKGIFLFFDNDILMYYKVLK